MCCLPHNTPTATPLVTKQMAETRAVDGADAARPKTKLTIAPVTPTRSPIRMKRRLLRRHKRQEASAPPPIIAPIGISVKNNVGLDCEKLLVSSVRRRK